MNSRRKFLMKGSMATTALLTAKPFTSLANALSPVTGFTVNNNKVVLLHTGNFTSKDPSATIKKIAQIKYDTGNVLLLHAGHTVNDKASHLKYDASMDPETCVSLSASHYQIIYKGNVKIGLIELSSGDDNAIEQVNTVASYLKKSKDCEIVVCLSQLGFKNKGRMDDITLAEQSSNLDVIIGGHATNFSKSPYISLNKHKQEVIINHPTTNDLALGKIEIEFDDLGKKKKIGFTNAVPRKITEANS
ncbi:MAG: hypothetical protein IPP31_01120 [Chitinophagaceae bacterium]|nr:hypothetical protein [Chitinophagaceae bacterium]